jgi:hypothetical protein
MNGPSSQTSRSPREAPKSHSHLRLLTLLIPALALGLAGCKKPADSAQPAVPPAPAERKAAEAKPAIAADAKAPALAASNASPRFLVFRNVRSWRRQLDFEEALTSLEFKFDVKPSAEMDGTDLSPYQVVIIPGAQWQDDFYIEYANNAALFDRYVTNGGTLLLELNGAERDGITLPRGASMARHGDKENAITLPDHPIMAPLAGQPIRANYASHGFLENVPPDALVLVTEEEEGQALRDKPTFVEYAHGAGRVIAACQCFHDQDGSGRGPLMESALLYAAAKKWFAPKK